MTTDNNNLGGLIAAVNSILSNTMHRVKFYFVVTEEDVSHLKAWIQSSKLHYMQYETKTISAAGNTAIAKIKLVKVNFGSIFSNLEGRVVYLDSDVIVQGDIWELFSINLTPGTYGAFAEDCSTPSSRTASSLGHPRYSVAINIKHFRLKNVAIDGTLCPFSTGVFVVNVTEWRSKDVLKLLHKWLEIHSEEPITGILPGIDEIDAAMLIAFYGKVTPLNQLWHIQHLGLGSGYSKQFIQQAKLLHWGGPFKPWHHAVAHSEEWDRYFVPDPTLQFRPRRRRA